MHEYVDKYTDGVPFRGVFYDMDVTHMPHARVELGEHQDNVGHVR